ncbi:Schwann cell myelin protein-like [Arapaima gigas]
MCVSAEASSVTIEQPRPLVSGHEATLTCTASGFYPQNASVLWSHRGDQVPPSSVTTETKKSNDGTFQLHSEYRFSPTATDHGTESSCTVSHPDWSDGRTDSISLSVSYGPSSATVTSHSAAVTHGSVRVEMGSNLSLTCVGDGTLHG